VQYLVNNNPGRPHFVVLTLKFDAFQARRVYLVMQTAECCSI